MKEWINKNSVATAIVLIILLSSIFFLDGLSNVTSYTTLNNARCISTNFPAKMLKGETQEVSFTLINNGR